MNDLRSKVIRLAHEQPALRPHLLPLLVKSAADKNTPDPNQKYEVFVEDAMSDSQSAGKNLSFKDAEKLIKKILDIVEKIGNWSGSDAALDKFIEKNEPFSGASEITFKGADGSNYHVLGSVGDYEKIR